VATQVIDIGQVPAQRGAQDGERVDWDALAAHCREAFARAEEDK